MRRTPRRHRRAIAARIALATVLVLIGAGAIVAASILFPSPQTSSPAPPSSPRPSKPVSEWDAATGVPSGTTLTKIDGDIRVTNPGAVLDSLDVHGRIIVRAPNVTIKRSIIRGGTVPVEGGLIDANQGEPGLKVVDSEIFATNPSPQVNGIVGFNFTLTRVEIRDVIDQVHIIGDNVTVKNSWLHDNVHYEEDPEQDGGPSHDDNVQVQSGRGITITGNNLSGAHAAVVQITQDRGPVSQLTFSENIVNDGWCSINVSEGDKGPVADVVVKDNTFGRTMAFEDCAVITPPSSPLQLSGNVFTDGVEISVRRGA